MLSPSLYPLDVSVDCCAAYDGSKLPWFVFRCWSFSGFFISFFLFLQFLGLLFSFLPAAFMLLMSSVVTVDGELRQRNWGIAFYLFTCYYGDDRPVSGEDGERE
ncbi:hypothetical protein EX30DRAFT_57527 [Ascodesmis nigricans]|uniref:Transmembrane protein n=1 Tax=Ascodesmis nigricans TaxID=341454 RepID=A0A4S2MUV9_9PEZI|nr:hypothetical protein EX30DRAFT_57527 [Ascodesmis nigricans]